MWTGSTRLRATPRADGCANPQPAIATRQEVNLCVAGIGAAFRLADEQIHGIAHPLLGAPVDGGLKASPAVLKALTQPLNV
jgi:hypothetical protein